MKSLNCFLSIESMHTFVLFCRTAGNLENKKWFLGLSVLIRFIAGIGSAMLVVAATSILMKGTSYKKSTIAVRLKTNIYYSCIVI